MSDQVISLVCYFQDSNAKDIRVVVSGSGEYLLDDHNGHWKKTFNIPKTLFKGPEQVANPKRELLKTATFYFIVDGKDTEVSNLYYYEHGGKTFKINGRTFPKATENVHEISIRTPIPPIPQEFIDEYISCLQTFLSTVYEPCSEQSPQNSGWGGRRIYDPYVLHNNSTAACGATDGDVKTLLTMSNNFQQYSWTCKQLVKLPAPLAARQALDHATCEGLNRWEDKTCRRCNNKFKETFVARTWTFGPTRN